jgi:hypothetical protein
VFTNVLIYTLCRVYKIECNSVNNKLRNICKSASRYKPFKHAGELPVLHAYTERARITDIAIKMRSADDQERMQSKMNSMLKFES